MAAADVLQSHLYRAFLDGRTHDVLLHVCGTWEGLYRLHRVVLIQSGFFKALFDGGFREADGDGKVEVHFDDPNITRAGTYSWLCCFVLGLTYDRVFSVRVRTSYNLCLVSLLTMFTEFA